MKKSIGLAAAALTALAVIATVPAYAGPPTDRPAPGTGPRATTVATAPLSDAEKTDIALMRDEERLAKELYEAFGEKWAVDAFTRIASSEQRHFDAMGTIITRYRLPDPAADAEVGTYSNPELQKLWDDWYARGMESKKAAIAVGVELETRDIADLKAAIETSDNPDLDRVYANLLRGSENHLKAFEALARGETRGPGRDRGPGARPMKHQNCPNR